MKIKIFVLLTLISSVVGFLLGTSEIIKIEGKQSKTPQKNPTENLKITIDKITNYKNIKALYFRRTKIKKGAKLVKELKSFGINGVVFDIKDIDGILSFVPERSDIKAFKSFSKSSSLNKEEFKELLYELHSNGIYTIARITLFKDCYIATRYKHLALKNKRYKRFCWLNPSNKKVIKYLLALTKETEEIGFDEIQYDYIRFPAGNEAKGIIYSSTIRKKGKTYFLEAFLKKARKILSQKTKIGIDIFGIVAWGRSSDIKVIGQHIPTLSRYIDVISPMLYPSHFSEGFDGYKNPADYPYRFIYKGCILTKRLIKETTIVRPWLQGFSYKTSTFSPSYIAKQIKAVKKCGGNGWMIWNSRNIYRVIIGYLKNKNAKNNAVD